MFTTWVQHFTFSCTVYERLNVSTPSVSLVVLSFYFAGFFCYMPFKWLWSSISLWFCSEFSYHVIFPRTFTGLLWQNIYLNSLPILKLLLFSFFCKKYIFQVFLPILWLSLFIWCQIMVLALSNFEIIIVYDIKSPILLPVDNKHFNSPGLYTCWTVVVLLEVFI